MNKNLIHRIGILLILTLSILLISGCSSPKTYNCDFVALYSLGEELQGPSGSNSKIWIECETGKIQDGSEIILHHYGNTFKGKVNSSSVFWDDRSIEGKILSGATGGFTKIKIESKSVTLTVSCQYPLDDYLTYIDVIMKFSLQ